MTQFYTDPSRESDPHALPNAEVFYRGCDDIAQEQIDNCTDEAFDVAADCGQMFDNVKHMTWFRQAVAEDCGDLVGWYYWPCFPGCLPDGDPVGPFETEAEAIADARNMEG